VKRELTDKVRASMLATVEPRRVIGFLCVCCTLFSSAQTQSTGRLAGIVRDPQGAAIVRAQVGVENKATGEKWVGSTDDSGDFALLSVAPGNYQIRIGAPGFVDATFPDVIVGLANTTSLNVVLQIARASEQLTVNDAPPLIRTDTAELSAVLDAADLASLPAPAHNVMQLLTLAPGVTAPPLNNSALGRNSPNVSVNGARVTHNSYQINGVDGNNISQHEFGNIAVPAQESIAEVKVQTSVYDASVAGAGGGSIQVVTSTGTNAFHGTFYEYLQNDALNANDPNLNAVGEGRPPLKRNLYGATFGGPVRKGRSFFFISYQGRRETNGATNQSLFKNVLIDPCLTSDRTPAVLMAGCKVSKIDPVALDLLNFKLPNHQFLIPTPQTPDGLVSGTAISTFAEDQFNTNFDYRLSVRDAFTLKFFFANAPLFSALGGSEYGSPASLPGFGTRLQVNNRVLSVQEIHTFSPMTVNEARFGYNFIRSNEIPNEPVNDSTLGMLRVTASQFPGLPLIDLARNSGGATLGTNNLLLRGITPSLSLMDSISLQRSKHYIRLGAEIRFSAWRVNAAVDSYGEIDFATFQDFLLGNSEFSDLGTGFSHIDLRTTDYHFFAQDDWRITPRLTLNAGLRYELNQPPFETRGLIGGFDPSLYQPRLQVDEDGLPVGPPAAGIIEAGNAPPEYSLTGVTRVDRRVLRSIDPHNFGPRFGVAWSPLGSGRLAVSAGYGIFYSRPSFLYVGLNYFAPPFFQTSVFAGEPFANPFPGAPASQSFPLVQMGIPLAATVLDRHNRNPYYEQFNASAQYEVVRDTVVQIAYAGSRGVRLFRSLNVNQSRIASLKHPVVNAVTGEAITVNTYDNAPLRAPMQGVDPGFFSLNQSSAQSTYHSLQATFNRRLSRGLQASVAYTYSKSIDNTSNPGGGAGSDGTLDHGGGLDTGNVWANYLNPRANRGLSDFDRTHVFVLSYVWDLPTPPSSRASRAGRVMFSNWRVSGIVSAMSGLPVDLFDPAGASVYGLVGARPNWAAGAGHGTALKNVPSGYYFNPFAFAEAIVQAGRPIPSANDPTALAGDAETDFGNAGRNLLYGPGQSNVDLSIAKYFPLKESVSIQLRADFFNALNHPNRNNPVSNIGVADIDSAGNIVNPGDFGRSIGFDSSPRMIQLSLFLRF
jgi:hypothetical protein